MENPMGKFLVLFCLVLLFNGCSSYRPTDNVGFDKIETLKELEGVYQNLGEGEQGNLPVYLSEVIWPKPEGIRHDLIATIEVRLLSPNSLGVMARSSVGVEKMDTFVEGTDFEIHSGRIRLKHSVGSAGDKYPVLYGPYYERHELGLDTKAHGKLRKHEGFVGLLMVMPVAAVMSEEVRFVRIDKVPHP
jgi:hypothetical protein